MLNEIELSEKFDEIFVNDEVIDFYLKWSEEKRKREDKRTKLQKIIPNFIFMSIISIISVIAGFIIYNITKDRVEQTVCKTYSGDMMFETIVWVNQDIVKMWSIPADQITDSIKIQQYKSGEKILNTIKK